MKKLFILLFSAYALLHAQLIDAIALTVNDEPVTLYDIDSMMAKKNTNKPQAVSIIIDEILYKQELKKHNISLDVFDLNNYLEKVAAQNGLGLYEFKSIIRQKYSDLTQYEKEAESAILRQKLVEKLLRGNLKLATDEDIKIYYDNNMNQFSTAKSFDVIQYTSKSKKALLAIRQNPMSQPQGVDIQTITLESDNLNSQFKYLLNDTKEKSLTPIFTANRNYVMLFIKQKNGMGTQSLAQVKQQILGIIMSQREQTFLKEYFEKLKITADIKVIR